MGPRAKLGLVWVLHSCCWAEGEGITIPHALEVWKARSGSPRCSGVWQLAHKEGFCSAGSIAPLSWALPESGAAMSPCHIHEKAEVQGAPHSPHWRLPAPEPRLPRARAQDYFCVVVSPSRKPEGEGCGGTHWASPPPLLALRKKGGDLFLVKPCPSSAPFPSNLFPGQRPLVRLCCHGNHSGYRCISDRVNEAPVPNWP